MPGSGPRRRHSGRTRHRRFTVERLLAILGPVAHAAAGIRSSRPNSSPADAASGRRPRAPVHARRPVEVADLVDLACRPSLRAGVARLGLGRFEGDAVVARRPATLWRRGTARGGSSPTCPGSQTAALPDHVLGIGGASTTLAQWTPRAGPPRARPRYRMRSPGPPLSRHATEIVATDISARASTSPPATPNSSGLSWGCAPAPFWARSLASASTSSSATRRSSSPRATAALTYEYRDGGCPRGPGHPNTSSLISARISGPAGSLSCSATGRSTGGLRDRPDRCLGSREVSTRGWSRGGPGCAVCGPGHATAVTSATRVRADVCRVAG